ncbi:hypothetical protein [Christiangramia aquimixticola]|uniref:hypothetical protein n=1 Tax=Christiangramia aquimixticola TaxID=1697558 RepID=UPI003AA84681
MRKKRINKSHLATKKLALWTLLWVVITAITSFGSKSLWEANDFFNLLAILLNLAVGIGVIIANRNQLNALDELQRKIQLEAMALTLGVAVIFGLAYSMLESVELISFNAEIPHLVILIGITYLAASIIGTRRYS